MLEIQRENHIYLFNFTENQPDQEHFFNIQYWQKKHRTLGYAQGRGKTWFLDTRDLFGVNTALRHYYRGGLWGKINKDRYAFSTLSNTRSFAEFYLLNQLYQSNFPVPKPIGAKIEKTAFGYYRADILTERIENAQDLTALLCHQSLTPSQWQQIGQLIRQLHNWQICHTDLNAHNILLQQNNAEIKFWLIDFDKCGKKQGEKWKLENLQRLQRSFHKEVNKQGIKFTPQNWQDLLIGYQA